MMASESKKGGEFKVFLLDPETSRNLLFDAESPLSIYTEYGPQWSNYNNAKPPEAFISDLDVETYNWKKQELTLSLEASERVIPDLAAESKLYQRIFFVALGSKKLYGGVTLEYTSHVAAKVPVISFIPRYMEKDRKTPDQKSFRRTLVIEPNFAQHVYSSFDPTLEVGKGSEIIRLEEVRSYFSSLNKLS